MATNGLHKSNLHAAAVPKIPRRPGEDIRFDRYPQSWIIFINVCKEVMNVIRQMIAVRELWWQVHRKWIWSISSSAQRKILILRFGFIRDQLFSLNSLKQEHEDISVGLKNRPTFRLSKLDATYSDKFVFKQMPLNPERSRKISWICIWNGD